MKILLALTRYADTGEGDVKQLKGSTDFRLRVGDYRVRMRDRASEASPRSISELEGTLLAPAHSRAPYRRTPGEQTDMRSLNLNFTVPLVKAVGRGS